MTIANITINGHTWTDADWRASWEGTMSGVANDIASVQLGIDAVGTLTKTLSGSTTLSGPEGQNLVFVFDGALSGDATVTFPSGFKGLACIVNKTSGSHQLVIGLASGATVTIPVSGGGLLYCDGTDFGITDGWVRTATGVKTAGTMQVGGAATITGAATFGSTAGFTGNATFGADVTVTDDLAVGDDATIGGDATVTGALSAGNITGSGTASIAGNITGGGSAVFEGAATVAGGALLVTKDDDETRIVVDAPAGESAFIEFDSAGVQRILIGRNNTAEAGGDAGSDFDIVVLSDAGSPIQIPLRIFRANGYIRMNALPTNAAGLEAGTLWNDGGTLKIA